MDIDLDFVSEPNPEADDWASSTKEPHPADNLEAQIQAFLRKGGKIQQIAFGQSATPDGTGAWNPSYYAGAGLSKEMVAAREEHNRRMAAARNKSVKRGAKNGGAANKRRAAINSPQLKHFSEGE